MNYEIGNRLAKLRKEKGLSQEQLADQLGVSRQAISKWETGSASPDTDNLICLSKLYGVSIDELLGVNVNETTSTPETEKVETNKNTPKSYLHIAPGGLHIKDGKADVDIGWKGIHIEDKGASINVDKSTIKTYVKENKTMVILESTIYSLLLLIATIAYICIGMYYDGGWSMGWLLYLLAISVGSIFTAIKEKKLCSFAIPVLAAGIYVFIGMYYGIWHPSWVVFLAIPLYYTICGPIDKLILKSNKPNPIFVKEKEENNN